MDHRRHKRYWQRFLLPDERVIHTFGVGGWYIFLFWVVPSVVALVLTIVLWLVNIIVGILMALICLSVAIPAIYLRYFVHYAITDQRVMGREGLLHKKFITADLPSITDVTVHENFLERILTRTGEVGVNTAGSHLIELYFRHVRKPFLIRHDIYKHQNSWRAENGTQGSSIGTRE